MQLWLEAECHQLLLDHVPSDSPAHDPLINASRVYNHGLMPDTYRVVCSPDDTRKYLAAAMRYFPEWVGTIVLAIITAKP